MTGLDSGSESDDEEVRSGLGDLFGGATRLVGLELFRFRLPVLRSLEELLEAFAAGGEGVVRAVALGEATMGLGSWITRASEGEISQSV